MKRIAVLLSALALTACATHPMRFSVSRHITGHVFVNDFLGVGFEYDASRQWVGADILGHTANGFQCGRDNAQIMAYTRDHGNVKASHRLGATCLHVKFVPPLRKGMVIVQPYGGRIDGFLALTVQYSATGKFIGARTLGQAADTGTCVKDGNATLESSFRHHKIPAGVSVLIYCVPVPQLGFSDGPKQSA